MKTLGNVSFIVLGVIIASFGELQFVLIGVLFQMAGILFEAIRLTMVQRLLSSSEFKMDPLVSLYYFAPACAVMNGVVALVVEVPRVTMQDFYNVGLFVLLANAMVAFFLNVSVVLLVSVKRKAKLATCLTHFYSSERQTPSSTLSPVSSRISSSSSLPCLSSATPLLPSNSSATASPSVVSSITSSEPRSSGNTLADSANNGVTTAQDTRPCPSLSSSALRSSSSSLSWAVSSHTFPRSTRRLLCTRCKDSLVLPEPMPTKCCLEEALRSEKA